MSSEVPQVAALEEHLGKRKPEGAAAHAEGQARAGVLAELARGYASAVEEAARIRSEEQFTLTALERLVDRVALVDPVTAIAAEALISVATLLEPQGAGPRGRLRVAGEGADGLRAALAGTEQGGTLLVARPGERARVTACLGDWAGGALGLFAPTELLPTRGEVLSLFAPEVLRLARFAGFDPELLVLRGAIAAERVAYAPEASGACALGSLLAGLGARGARNVTLLVPPTLQPLADWLETLSLLLPGAGPQLIAGEPLEGPAAYGDDRLFVELRLTGSAPDPRVRRLNAAGLPTLQLALESEQLLAEVVRFELALAFAAGAAHWPPRGPGHESQGPAQSAEPALRDGALTLFCSPAHAAVLRKVAGTLGPKAAASAPHWLAAQLALGSPGDRVQVHFCALPTAAVRAALPAVQTAVRGATRLATRARLGLGALGPHAVERAGGAEGTLLFLLSDGGGAELGPSPGPASAARRAEERVVSSFGEAGRPALLLRAEDGDASKLCAAVLDAASLLARPK